MSSPARTLRHSMWLLALLAVALVSLIMMRGRAPKVDYTLGGPLFDVPATAIDGLLLTRDGAQYRLDRQDDGVWVLGGATSDWLEANSMLSLLRTITNGRGGPLLPGTEPEDRRYEFNGDESIRLTVFGVNGNRSTLVLGTSNPVTGNFYGSGAGREHCFPVSPDFRNRLAELPNFVRLTRILPPFAPEALEGIELARDGEVFRLERRTNRWWLLRNQVVDAALSPLARSYHGIYDDRRLDTASGRWLLADERVVANLIYEVSESRVREFLSPTPSESQLRSYRLDPPWRQVTFIGKGLDPDRQYGVLDRLTAAFGPPADDKIAPVMRRDQILMTDNTALGTLRRPLGDLVDAGAFTFRFDRADSFMVEREGFPIMSGRREQQEWEASSAPGVWSSLDPEELTYRSRQVALEMDRTPLLAVLPPTSDPRVLADKDRVRMTIWFSDAGDTVVQTRVVEFGYLQRKNMSGGESDLVTPLDGIHPIVAWLPDSGQLLQVKTDILITARNLVEE